MESPRAVVVVAEVLVAWVVLSIVVTAIWSRFCYVVHARFVGLRRRPGWSLAGRRD